MKSLDFNGSDYKEMEAQIIDTIDRWVEKDVRPIRSILIRRMSTRQSWSSK